jgi:DNA (cytosine-5)-methyltransferase 1
MNTKPTPPLSPSGSLSCYGSFVGTHLDLFSGIGGFAIAACNAGWNTIGFCEIDEAPSKVLQKNWPEVPNYGDIRKLQNVKADLITGGFPCQPFSDIGMRRGKDDDRWLWPEMLRVIVESEPTWILGENVAGFVRMGLETVLSDLEAEGFESQPLVIPAAAVRAHHRRNRCWILAWNSARASERARTGNAENSSVPRTNRNPQCAAMSLLHRAADGLPGKLDRLHALGNAIVPQVAEVILTEMARLHCGHNA